MSLGIGIAKVELDLGELNNSKVSYAFDLYEISGKRDGCTVTLEYRIAGVLAKTEIRRIPDCEDEKKQEPKDNSELSEEDPGTDRQDEPYEVPPGNLWDEGFWLLSLKVNKNEVRVFLSGLWEVHISRQITNVSGKITEIRGSGCYAKAESYYYRFINMYYQPASGYQGLLQKSDYPHEDNLKSEYVFDGWSGQPGMHPGERRLMTNTSFYQNASVHYCTNGELLYFMRRHLSIFRSNPVPIDTFGGYSDSYFNSPVITILDYVINKPGFPSRQGNNGTTNKKREIGGKNEMDDKCCQMIAEIYEALAVDEILSEGLNVPNKLVITKGTGTTQLSNYLQVLAWQIRMADHLGVHPFKAEIADIDPAKAGKQKAELQVINATAAMQKILENSMMAGGYDKAIIKTLAALAMGIAQIINIVSITSKRSREIMRFLTIPVRDKVFKIPVSFNMLAFVKGKKQKGFGKSPQEKIRIDTETEIEDLLPNFLQPAEQEIIVEMWDDDRENLREILGGESMQNNRGVINK